MTRRISAGELEDRYKLKHLLYDFFDEMYEGMFRNLPEKGMSWRDCSRDWLLEELTKHVKRNDWVSASNFCFMLRDLEKIKR